MLDTGSPPDHETAESRTAVSPLTSRPLSRSSSPGISYFDGTPLYLSALPDATYHLSLPTLPSGMAVKTARDELPYHVGPPSPPKEVETIQDEPPDETEAKSDNILDGDQRPAEQSVSCLRELTHLLRLEKYQSQRSRQIEQQLYTAHVRAARSARLHHLSRSVHRILAECIHAEDKHAFVNLFNAFNDAIAECTEPSAGVSVEQESVEQRASLGYPSSFLDSLRQPSQSTILRLLALIRNDGDFLAGRLTSLSHKDLIALLPDRSIWRADHSVFGSSSRSSFRNSKHLGFVVDGQTDLISSSAHASPIETLIHSVRDVSNDTLESDELATDVWSTVCAKLIAEQRPGSEKLVPAILDQWAFSSSLAGKERLETWLSQTLQKGSVLLEQVQKQSFRVRIQARSDSTTQEESRLETFFATAVDRLLGLLTDGSGASIIPSGVLKLCNAIFRKLRHSARHQQLFPNFAITRWLFSTFIPETLFLPEMHGMLSDLFISDTARQRILREIANRCQKAVFDVIYAWKYGSPANEAAAKLVHTLADKFRSTTSTREGSAGPYSISETQTRRNENTFVAISPVDVCTLLDALYPAKGPPSLAENDSVKAGLRSSSSSISGFSLFQGIGAIEPSLTEPTEHAAELTDRLEHEIDDDLNVLQDATVACPKDLSHTDEESLREIRGAVEDIASSRRPDSPLQWCILVHAQAPDAGFTTVHQELLRPFSAVSKAIVDSTLSSSCKACRGIVEELLEQEIPRDVYDDYGLPQDGAVLLDQIHAVLGLRTKQLEAEGRFVEAHAYFRKSQHIGRAKARSERPCNLIPLLDGLRQRRQMSLRTSLTVIERCDGLMRLARDVLEKQSLHLLGHGTVTEHLRNKMWYIADVRVSAIYDEVRAVSLALKAMSRPNSVSNARPSNATRNWSANKTSSTALHSKTEAQILEIISAPPDRGGRNKLSDEQSKAVLSWMEIHVVENFCRGEERLHKFCMEIRKAVDQITADGSALRSSALFARDTLRQSSPPFVNGGTHLMSLDANKRRLDMLALQTNVSSNYDVVSNRSSHALSARSSRDHMESWSPSTTNRSSVTFWSPATTDLRSPSSVTSIGSSQTQGAPLFTSDQQTVSSEPKPRNADGELRQHLTSLILSDVGNILFGDGSETDLSLRTGIGGDLFEKYLASLNPAASQESNVDLIASFNFQRAFEELTQRLSTSTNLNTKLKRLSEIDTLLGLYCTHGSVTMTPSRDNAGPHGGARFAPDHVTGLKTADIKIEGFKRLFCNSSTRPESIFRDLQYIAALLPESALQTTSQSKAFWNAAAAISSLKREACNLMVETADNIIAYHSNDRGRGRSSSVAQRERDSAAFPTPNPAAWLEDVDQCSMPDAATLLQITAREGYRVAQRELATLYLTHPELMDHVIAPFARPREVFKEELENKWRRNQDPARCDPATMCVAHHWMSLSSKGGDALATEFLRQREEMDRLP